MTHQDACRIGLQWLTDHRMRLLTRADALSHAYDGGPMRDVCKDIAEIYYEQADNLDGAIARYTQMANAPRERTAVAGTLDGVVRHFSES